MDNQELIDKLKIAREDINLIVGMVNRIKDYKESILEAKEKIDTILYELTGDIFFISDHKDKPNE